MNGAASLRRQAWLKQSGPTQDTILRDQAPAASGRRSPRENPLPHSARSHSAPSDSGRPNLIWPNVFWPSLRRREVGAAGTLGRLIHWTGVVMAGLCALLAAEFAVEGWATHLSRSLLVAAVVLAFGTRALRYMLARE
jgi:hypothetical protein